MSLLSHQQFRLGPGGTTIFGCGTIRELARLVAELSRKRACVVTDRGVVAAGIGGRVEQILESAGIETVIFEEVHPNPSTETLTRGARMARDVEADVIIALGGGSALDAAKGIALMAINEGQARDFDYRNEPSLPGLPVIAIPTTAGTGAETNGFGVIDDPELKRKFYVGHASVIARHVILDPELTCGLPPEPTAATGMDTLVHAFESLSSRRGNPYAEGIGLQVTSMVHQFLPRAVSDGQDLEARAQMLLGAHMAGLGFATTGLGVGHAIAHALSARLGLVHGVALTVLLPHVLAFNLPVRREIYARVAWAWRTSDSRRSDQDNAEAIVDAVRQFALRLGMPVSLRELGCAENAIPAIADDALQDEVVENTPRKPSYDDLQAILQAAL